MSVWKRYKGKKVLRGNPDYNKATWIAEGKVDGRSYKKSLPKETIKTAEQARTQDDAIRAKIRNNEYDFLRDKTKFSDFVDADYLPYAKQQNANYKTKIFETNPLKLFFKQTFLKSITPQLCEQYKNWRRLQYKRCQKCAYDLHDNCDRELISPSTVNRELTTLSAILTRAAFLGKIKDNPMRFVGKLAEPESRERFLTEDEKVKLLYEVSKHKLLHLYVLLAIMTGWRSGQILSQRRSALDAETRTALLIKSKQQKVRRVSVSNQVWRILSFLSAQSPDDYLFYNPKTKTRYLSFKRKWTEALKRAAIADFRFHDLRRCFASDMLKVSASDLLIKNALGHSRIDTTSIYARAENELLRESLNAVSDNLNLDLDAILTPSAKNGNIENISQACN